MLKLKPLIIILFLLFMMVSVTAQSQPTKIQSMPQSKSRELTQQKTSNQQNPPVQFITPQQMIDSITRAIDASKDKNKAAQNSPPPDNSQWWFSLFLVIFTFCLVIVGSIQCYIIFGTLRETQVVAKAATDSARVADQALQISERAYLSVDEFQFKVIGVGSHIRIDYEIKNIGHTPAQITKTTQVVDIINIHNIPTEPDYSVCKSNSFNHFLRPNGNVRRFEIMDSPITIDQFKNINDGNCSIAMWGKIIYKDIFQKYYVVGFGTMYNHKFRNHIFMDGYNYISEDKENSDSN